MYCDSADQFLNEAPMDLTPQATMPNIAQIGESGKTFSLNCSGYKGFLIV